MRSDLAPDTSQSYADRVLALKPTPLPLTNWDDGSVRVTGTRVTLDVIVGADRGGATPADITRMFPTVTLDAVYAILAWVLQNKEEGDAYLAAREAEAQAMQEEEERLHPPEGIKARLLARRRST